MEARPRFRPLRGMLRFAASVLVVSGVLLIADAGVTLVWQEPVSAFMAQRQQAELERELAEPPPRVIRREPLPGDAIGKIVIPAIGVSEFLVEGTDAENLRKGPGHYPETPLPGERGTVAIAGHRTTYGAPFRKLDELHRGDRIRLEMPQGTFVYRVQRTRVVASDAFWILEPKPYDRLVLSACHPLYSAAQRIATFARLVGRQPAEVEWRSPKAADESVPISDSSRDSKNITSRISRATETATTASQ